MTDVVAFARSLLRGPLQGAPPVAPVRRAYAFWGVGALFVLLMAMAGSTITRNCCAVPTTAPRTMSAAASTASAIPSVTPDCSDGCDAPLGCPCPCRGTCPCVTGHSAALAAFAPSHTPPLTVASQTGPATAPRVGPGRLGREPAIRPPIA